MCETQQRGFKWEHASLSNDVPALVMWHAYTSYGMWFIIVMGVPGGSARATANVGLGLLGVLCADPELHYTPPLSVPCNLWASEINNHNDCCEEGQLC